MYDFRLLSLRCASAGHSIFGFFELFVPPHGLSKRSTNVRVTLAENWYHTPLIGALPPPPHPSAPTPSDLHPLSHTKSSLALLSSPTKPWRRKPFPSTISFTSPSSETMEKGISKLSSPSKTIKDELGLIYSYISLWTYDYDMLQYANNDLPNLR